MKRHLPKHSLLLGVTCLFWEATILPDICVRAEEPKERATLKGHKQMVESVAFSPDDKTLASASHDRTIKLWDVTTGKERATFRGHECYLASVAFSPDGKTLASGSHDRTIKLWDVATAKERASLEHPTRQQGTRLALAFSPDSRTLASASGRTVTVWDVATGKERATLQGHTTVAFSPDGRTLASGSGDDTVKLWDVATGKERVTLQGHTGSVVTVAFSPDGKTLASGSYDNTIKLWEVASRKERATFKGHRVCSVTFSSNGKFLAAGNDDESIKLWDMATGKERPTLKGHTDSVQSVAFSRDGKILASGDAEGTIKLWDIPATPTVQPTRSGALASEDLDRLWTRLAGDDAAKAYQAIRAFISAPAQAVPLVQERLRPVPKPNSQDITRWITDLESEQFTVRERASEAFEKIGGVAEPALRTKLADKPTLEARQRIERLLSNIEIEQQNIDPQSLRALRAVEVLEYIGTSEAKQLLAELATGAEGARLTREARASLERLRKRG